MEFLVQEKAKLEEEVKEEQKVATSDELVNPSQMIGGKMSNYTRSGTSGGAFNTRKATAEQHKSYRIVTAGEDT